MRQAIAWIPAAMMALGALFAVGIDTQRSISLALPLATVVPRQIEDYVARDVEISDGEIRIAAPTEYLMRTYEHSGDSAVEVPWFSLYIGYYARQMRGTTIHSPKNCLPGAGWEALDSEATPIQSAELGAHDVNRYILQREGEQVLVLYWYQGRGRIEHNEYVVKWDLLRDSASRHRSEEALVRIVVPVTDSQDKALAVASQSAAIVAQELKRALPGW